MNEFSYGQTEDHATQELKITAAGLFKEGEYAKAYEVYTQLLSRYPKDGLFNYYAGIALLKQKVNVVEAIRLLEYSSSKAQVPSDVYYYLGQAYRETYKFPESRDAFKKYANMAGKNEMKEKIPHREAEMATNAERAIVEYNPFDILATSLFTFRDTNYIRQVKGKGGQLTIKPRELFGKDEKEGELTNYMFMPKSIEKGDYIYVSAFGRSKKKGYDIFRIKKLNGNGWGEPSAIEALNSPYDEIMPYFDPIGKDIYFASKGHNSMGGYDIFKSHYDQERDNWSEPVRLGFPINSPSNEYLVIPGSDLGTIQLITDRQGIDSMYTVYKLHMQEPKRPLTNVSKEEVRRIGKLGGIEAIPSIVDLRKDAELIKEAKSLANQRAQEKEVQNEAASSNNVHLKRAMGYQLISDSLSLLAKDARINVKELSDPNERWDWQRKIIEWDKQSKDFQQKANISFAELKFNEEAKENKPVPSTIKMDTVINGITVYNYTGNKASTIPFNEDTQASNDSEEILATTITPRETLFSTTKEKITNEETSPKENKASFAILPKSPYNQMNPFQSVSTPPKGAFYRIQLGVYSQQRDWDAFGGISPIVQETMEERGLIKYYAGGFDKYEEARGAVEKIKLLGFSDAFIVGWYDGQKTSVERVNSLEKRDLQ